MTVPSRRKFLGAAAAYAVAPLVAGAEKPGDVSGIGKTPHTRFAVNIEMWFARLPFLKRIEAAAALGFPAVEFWPLEGKDIDAVADNMEKQPWEITTVTAAAVTLLRYLGRHIPPAAAAFLLAQRHEDGGFLAVPGAPMPDLLSTATALHALAGLHVDLDPLRESCLDFIDTLWTGQGFCGNWSDDIVDSEYTYYGLLSLGHLSV